MNESQAAEKTNVTEAPTPAAACCSHDAAKSGANAAPAPGIATFRVPTMDCAVEEGEIRNALERVSGIKRVRFDLGARTVGINAPPEALLSLSPPFARPASIRWAVAPAEPGKESEERHDHSESADPWRLGLALSLALVAEAVHYFAPESTVMKGSGLALAAVAIWLAGVDTYTKGFTALRRGKLNINALMSVAVDRCLRHRAVARGGHGDGAVRDR